MIRKLARIFKLIEGHKSQLIASIGFLTIVGNIFGLLTREQAEGILTLCGSGYTITMASKLSRLIQVIKEVQPITAETVDIAKAETVSVTVPEAK